MNSHALIRPNNGFHLGNAIRRDLVVPTCVCTPHAHQTHLQSADPPLAAGATWSGR